MVKDLGTDSRPQWIETSWKEQGHVFFSDGYIYYTEILPSNKIVTMRLTLEEWNNIPETARKAERNEDDIKTRRIVTKRRRNTNKGNKARQVRKRGLVRRRFS